MATWKLSCGIASTNTTNEATKSDRESLHSKACRLAVLHWRSAPVMPWFIDTVRFNAIHAPVKAESHFRRTKRLDGALQLQTYEASGRKPRGGGKSDKIGHTVETSFHDHDGIKENLASS